jgi:ParB-like chromosome segregation protein Spo0J
VPCVEMEVDEGTVAEIALIENMQRKDLTVWEEADGLLALCDVLVTRTTTSRARLVRAGRLSPKRWRCAKIPADVRKFVAR